MSKDDATWLNICYVAFGLVVFFVGFKAVHTIGLHMNWTERYDEWFPMANNLLGLAIGAGTVLWVRSSAERKDYHLATIGEIRKITWPSIPDTKRMTIIVAIVVAIFAAILAVFDVVWSKTLQLVLS